MRAKLLFAATAVAALGLASAGPATQTHAALGTTAIQTGVPTDFDTTWNILLAELDAGDIDAQAGAGRWAAADDVELQQRSRASGISGAPAAR